MPQQDHSSTTTRNNSYSYKTYNASSTLTAQGSNIGMGTARLVIDNLDVNSVVTPNWESYKRWNLPNQPYYKYSLLIQERGGVFEQVAQNVSTGAYTNYVYDTNLGGLSLSISDNAATDADDLTQKVISKLISDISLVKAESAVTAAEFGKTAQHLAHTATRVYQGLSALRSGRFGDFAKAIGMTYTSRDVQFYNKRYNRARSRDAKEKIYTSRKMVLERGRSRVTDLVCDTWLEYSYGWKPLLSDLYSHTEAFASMMVEAGNSWRYATAKATHSRETFKNTVSGQTLIRDKKISKKFMAMGVRYRIPTGALNITTAFGLQNPLVVAWELVPFSFVVDWFLPIGNALSALTAFSGLEFHSGWKSTKHIRENTRELLPAPTYITGGVSYTVTKSTVKGSMQEYGQTREVLTSFPSFGFPQWKDPRSLAHGASAIALLQSLFLRK